MKPRIAMTASLEQSPDGLRLHAPVAYAEAVEAAGGLPLVLPPPEDPARAAELLGAADGLLLVGGGDLSSTLWGKALNPATRLLHPRRQKADLALLAAAEDRRMPVLGICLGCQEVAVHRGGSLIQHLYDDPKVRDHGGGGRPKADHMVMVEPDSSLARLIGPEPLHVNSTHHQAVRDPGRAMRRVAAAEDGVIEAIEDVTGERFFLGVQWHPERLRTEPRHLALFEGLVEAAGAFGMRTG
jgi:putative glutamine amidotransferase